MNATPDTFLVRLEYLAHGRDLRKWLFSLGWNRGDIDRIRNEGHIPGAAKLAALARAEKISLTWLLTGQGEPFIAGGALKLREPPARYGKLLAELDELDPAAIEQLLRLARLLKRKR